MYIITGEINRGKTTKLLSLYQEIKHGDGFACKKIFVDGINVGQEIVRLSSGERRCFSFKDGYIPNNWDEECRCGSYSFSKGGFTFAEKIVRDIIREQTEPAFIDEIGLLELKGKGLYNIFVELLKEKKEVYAVIRESLLNCAIKKFSIKNYTIIRV